MQAAFVHLNNKLQNIRCKEVNIGTLLEVLCRSVLRFLICIHSIRNVYSSEVLKHLKLWKELIYICHYFLRKSTENVVRTHVFYTCALAP